MACAWRLCSQGAPTLLHFTLRQQCGRDLTERRSRLQAASCRRRRCPEGAAAASLRPAQPPRLADTPASFACSACTSSHGSSGQGRSPRVRYLLPGRRQRRGEAGGLGHSLRGRHTRAVGLRCKQRGRPVMQRMGLICCCLSLCSGVQRLEYLVKEYGAADKATLGGGCCTATLLLCAPRSPTDA